MKSPWFWLLVGVVTAILFGANGAFARRSPGGTDFLVHWVAARRWMQFGDSPYSDATTREIQQRIYGRPARPGEHQQRVVYPLYSVAVFAPFALIGDFALARAAWMTVLELGLLGMLLGGLQVLEWRPDRWTLALLALFAIGWYHGVRAVINGNAVVLVAFALTLVPLAVRHRQDEIAGLLLAVSTIKPNLALLPLLMVSLWAISRQRWRLVGFAWGGWVLLAGLATFWRPIWWLEYLRELLRFPTYNPPGTLQAVLRVLLPVGGAAVGTAITVLLAILLVWAWWRMWGQSFAWFLWVFNLTLVISQWIGIQTDPGNFVLLFLPLLQVLSIWQQRWGRAGVWLTRLTLAALGVGLWWLFLETLTVVGGQPMQSVWLFFPMPLVTLIGLIWVQWWAVHAPLWAHAAP